MKTLSIITINKNNASGLEKTIQSVLCQTSNDFEYIIIDGASTDRSVELIKNHVDRINYWVSETDTGIYNAMNKGIKKAQGEYCLFLNSGDIFISPETLENVFKEINGNPADIFYSNKVKSNKSIAIFPKNLNNFLLHGKINHQNTFIKSSLFHEHGFYNENLKLVSDWEFFLKELYIYKSTFCHINTNISLYDNHGISVQNQELHNYENTIAIKNVFQDLSSTIIEYSNFRNTIFFDIHKNYNTNFINYILKIYRKILLLIIK